MEPAWELTVKVLSNTNKSASSLNNRGKKQVTRMTEPKLRGERLGKPQRPRPLKHSYLVS